MLLNGAQCQNNFILYSLKVRLLLHVNEVHGMHKYIHINIENNLLLSLVIHITVNVHQYVS